MAQDATSEPAQALDRQFKAAVAAYDAGRFAQAATQLERLLPLAPQSFELHELLGLTYGAEALDAKAVEQLAIAVKLKPDSEPARANLATGLARSGHPGEAEAVARKALELAPADYDTNHKLAEIYLDSGKIAAAVPLLEAAHHARPSSYDTAYDLALAYLLVGRLEEARQLTEGLLSKEERGETHGLLGRIDEKQGRFLEAASQFASAAHLDPSEDNLFAWASELLLHRTYEPAVEVFRQATLRYPKSPRLFIGLGMALYSRGEYQPSIDALLTAANLDPLDPRCYLFLSKAYLSSPSQAQAVIDCFKRYAALEPQTALAQYYYAMSLWKGKRMEEASIDYQTVESLLQKAIVLDATLAEPHLQLGILYNNEHEYARSRPELERALELNQDLPDAHYRLAQYYVHAGDKAKAQDEFNLFRKLELEHRALVDKERAEVRQFVVAAQNAPSGKP